MTRRLFGCNIVLTFGLPAAPDRNYHSAARKLDRLEQEEIPPGAWVEFSPAEVNSYATEELAGQRISGVRAPKVELGAGLATGSAMIDFLKVRESFTDEPPGYLSQLFLGGEKAVVVEAEIRTAGGMCTIAPVRVAIQGVEVRGAALDWLIENLLIPRFPSAKVNRPFRLPHRVERVDVSPAGVRVRVLPRP